ncbi:protein FAM124B [Grus japonensis]|uniref:Protein FAM124B n=1 Tax=Grus japonensis TaxID=30415 RepID=A0ABC9X789_GRUJA
MGDGADSLMTVHLLANSGHSLLLQQTLDQLLEWICPDVQLFLVSERVTPLRYYERYHKRSCGFPGISVLLFLHEDLGEERIFQVHELFQRPPWRYQCAQIANGQSHRYVPAHQDFYGLDDQMPVWGIRRVHCGPEILRVTLYCSFDNYEDAVRLYEMILQKEAAVQKSNFCVFVLYATQNTAVQLCLKQLPIGVAAEPKDSSALQFKVQEIGQLVPLLPNPCIPISSTRWQTQDYEGNKILLQVQDSSKPHETNVGLSHPLSHAGNEKILQDSVPAALPVKRDEDQHNEAGWCLQHPSLKLSPHATGAVQRRSQPSVTVCLRYTRVDVKAEVRAAAPSPRDRSVPAAALKSRWKQLEEVPQFCLESRNVQEQLELLGEKKTVSAIDWNGNTRDFLMGGQGYGGQRLWKVSGEHMTSLERNVPCWGRKYFSWEQT